MYIVKIINTTFRGDGNIIVFEGTISEAAFIELLKVFPPTPAYRWEVMHGIQNN